MTTTSLVLGSGGARGLAHIGVIECLEAHGYDIRYVSGSSMGALVGGIYAAGKLDVYAEWVAALQKLDVLRLLDWSLGGGALFKGEKIMQVMTQLVGDRKIEELPIGFTAIATELSTGREIWLNRGSLFEAIRASIAVPLVFSAVKHDDLLLVDGGLVNPVPVAPTLNDWAEVTVAVDLNGPDEVLAPVLAQRGKKRGDADPSYRARIAQFVDALMSPATSQPPAELGFYDLAARTMETMQRTITQLKMATYAPTILIRIPRNLCGLFDFHRAKELIAFGYERAERAITRYESDRPAARRDTVVE